MGIGSNQSNGIHFEPWGCQKYDRSDAPIRGLREKWPFVSKIHLRVGCELRDPKQKKSNKTDRRGSSEGTFRIFGLGRDDARIQR